MKGSLTYREASDKYAPCALNKSCACSSTISGSHHWLRRTRDGPPATRPIPEARCALSRRSHKTPGGRVPRDRQTRESGHEACEFALWDVLCKGHDLVAHRPETPAGSAIDSQPDGKPPPDPGRGLLAS